jgi:nitrate/TMAO reductase-like tetraheme cytochrome c subunit
MKKGFAMPGVVLLSSLMFVVLVWTTDAYMQESTPKAESGKVAAKCLACHGPYDKLAETTTDFKAKSGETVTPHMYVPHAEKTDIPACTECHTPHEIPLGDKSEVVKPDNLDYCYHSCHHMQNFQTCSTCH